MNALDLLLGRVVSSGTAAASSAAEAKAAELYERFKPLIWAGAFMAVTAWVFFVVPRMRLPWQRVD